MKTVTINKRSIWAAAGVMAILASTLVGVQPTPALADDVPAGIDPNNPIQMVVANGQTIVQTGQLGPLQEVWFEVTTYDVDDRYVNQEGSEEDREDRKPLDLSLIVAPIEGNDIQNIRMDLFPASYAAHWSHGHFFTPGLAEDEEDVLIHAAPFGSGSVAVVESEDGNSTTLFFEGEGDERVGKLMWSGRANENEPFLVRVRNETGSTKDFALFTDDISDVDLSQVAQTEAVVAEETTAMEETAVAEAMAMVKLMAGIDPNNPIPVAVDNTSALIQAGRLPAVREVWFKVIPPTFAEAQDTDSDNIAEADKDEAPAVDLTLFVTPVEGNTIDQIKMDVFPASYAQHWSHGHIYRLGLTDDEEETLEHAAPFGAGSVAVVEGADEDEQVLSFLAEGAAPVGKLVWSGRANENEPFLVRVSNETGLAKDYALFNGDIGDVDLSQVPQTQSAVAEETAGAETRAMAEELVMANLRAGTDPNYPLQVMLVNGQVVSQNGRIPNSDEVWFAVTTSDIDDRYINQGGSEEDREDRAPLDLTLFFTPVEGNTIDQVQMELFPANYDTHWSHGHIYRFGLSDDEEDEVVHAAPIGRGSLAVVDGADEDDQVLYFQAEDGAPVGKLNWSGRAYANETILVRVANDTGKPIDYVLYTADVADFGN